MLQWPSQSLYLNPIENLCSEVHTYKPKNINELKYSAWRCGPRRNMKVWKRLRIQLQKHTVFQVMEIMGLFKNIHLECICRVSPEQSTCSYEAWLPESSCLCQAFSRMSLQYIFSNTRVTIHKELFLFWLILFCPISMVNIQSHIFLLFRLRGS